MYTRTSIETGGLQLQITDLSHTLPAEESGLSSPGRLCCYGSVATVSGVGAAHVLTAFVTLFTCQRARYRPPMGVFAHPGGATHLNHRTGVVKVDAAGISTFFALLS